MKPRYLQVETGGRDRWMISYMDVLTILLIFFVAVAAKSVELSKIELAKIEPAKIEPAKIEPAKIETSGIEPLQNVAIAGVTIAGVTTVPPDPVRTPTQKMLEEYGLDWRAEARGLVISLPQAVLFKPGRAEVNPAALPTVGRIATILRGIPNRISLAGHADQVPIHNRRFKNNWELAAARSLELLNLLTARYEIAESRFSISSYGSSDPRSSNDTFEGRANNRRVEILILDESPTYPSAGK
jgi:chemotaxis protein MotB